MTELSAVSHGPAAQSCEVGTKTISLAEISTQLDSLEQQAADQFNPPDFSFIRAMIRRAAKHSGPVKDLIGQRAQQKLDDYRQALDTATQLAQQQLQQISQDCPDHTTQAHITQARELFEAYKFAALAHLLQRLQQQEAAPLKPQRQALAQLSRELLRDNSLAQAAAGQSSLNDRLTQQENRAAAQLSDPDDATETAGELSAIRLFRESWTKINANNIVDQALKQGPKNAGPLNPENLAIRSLATLRTLSPQYTNRFISYADTLLWLQQVSERNNKRKKSAKRQD